MGSLLALIGAAPFALFVSELLVLRAAVEARAYGALVLFLLGVGVVFVSALRQAVAMAFRPEETVVGGSEPGFATTSVRERALVLLPLVALALLGVWMPAPLASAIGAAARVVGGQP